MRAYEIVLERIETDLESGRVVMGGRLPGERVLADELGVSRGSVREAMQVLEARGVVRRSTGSGQDAGAIVVADAAASIGPALRMHVASRAVPVADVVEARVLLETWAVAHAAESDQPLAPVEQLLAAMDDPALEPAEFLTLDAELHVALAAMSGNVLIGQIMASLRQAIESYVQRAVPLVHDWPDVLDRLRHEHHAVVDAVRAGDATAAQAAVRAHIEGFYRLSGLA